MILRDYYNKHNQIFKLPDGEPIFTNTSIRLRSLVEKLNSKNSLVVLSVSVFPLKTEIRKNYDLSLKIPQGKYDCLIVTIGHAEFKKFSKKEILALLNKRALIVDVRGVWKKINFPPNLKVWNL